jgi:hypothetical protein
MIDDKIAQHIANYLPKFLASLVALTLDLSFTNARRHFRLPNLRKLSLAGCHWVDDQVLLEISSTKLTEINLYWCVNVTDEGLGVLINRNPQITTLVLSGCNKLTDATLRVIADKLPLLVSLDLTRVPLATDAGLKLLGNSQMRNSLRELNLYAKTQNVDPSFYPTIANFAKLRMLDLCGHLKLTDEVMTALVPHLPLLEKLNLSWCVEIGDNTVNALTESKVTWLSVFGIKKISAAAIEAFLEKRRKSITALDIRGIPSVRHLTADNCAELRAICPRISEWKIHT